MSIRSRARSCRRPARLRSPSLLAAVAATCAASGTAQEPAFAQARGWVGIRFDAVGQSVVVADVYRSGPAHRGGVRPGDVVVAVDGAPVSGGGLARAASELSPGQMLRLTVVRDGAEHALTVVAGQRPPAIDAGLAADRFVRAQSRLFRTMDSLLRVLSTGEAELGRGDSGAQHTDTVPPVAMGFRVTSPRTAGSPFVLGGARARDLGVELGRYFGVGAGVLLTDVLASTPAAVAGFRPGDVIVSLAGRDVATLTELRAALSGSPVPYELTVVRRRLRVVIRYPRER